MPRKYWIGIGSSDARLLASVTALGLVALAACTAEGPSDGDTPMTTAGAATTTTAGAGSGGGGASSVAGSSTGGSSAGSGGSSAGLGGGGLGGGGLGGGGLGGSAGTAGLAGMAGGAGAGGVGGMGGAAGSGGDPNTGGLDAGKQTARPIGMPFAKNGFWEYLPRRYGNGFKYPLLVFWAGVGENGDGSNGALQVIIQRHGPPMMIDKDQWPEDRPFIVLSPQHDASSDRPTPTEIHDFLTFAMDNYDVDPARVYITGLSSGARGFWAYLGQYKGEQVTAAVLIAADSSVAYDAGGCAVVNQVPLWTFHGSNDSEVPIADENEGMNGFTACPEPPRKEVKYTVYPNTSHQDSWTKTYSGSAGHDVFAWMLSKTR